LKGQLLSSDLIVGMALLMLAIGVTLQLSEAFQRQLYKSGSLYSNDPDAAVQAIYQGASYYYLTTRNFCYQYSNGSGNCTGFSCGGYGNMLVSKRFSPCEDAPGYCTLEVRVCR